jgi:hypothetical protein
VTIVATRGISQKLSKLFAQSPSDWMGKQRTRLWA